MICEAFGLAPSAAKAEIAADTNGLLWEVLELRAYAHEARRLAETTDFANLKPPHSALLREAMRNSQWLAKVRAGLELLDIDLGDDDGDD